MLVFITVCFAIGGVSLIASLLLFILHLIFEHKPENLGKSRGFIKSTKQKNNVPVYERSSPKAFVPPAREKSMYFSSASL